MAICFIWVCDCIQAENLMMFLSQKCFLTHDSDSVRHFDARKEAIPKREK